MNSTLVYRGAVSIAYSLLVLWLISHLLHIDTGGSFEDLIDSSMDHIVVSRSVSLYLDNGSVSCSRDGQRLHRPKCLSGLPHTSSLEDLSLSVGAIWKGQADDLVISGEFDLAWWSALVLAGGRWGSKAHVVQNNQGSIDTSDGVVLDMRDDRVGRGLSRVTHDC